jgi:hypothetical protein
VDGHVDALLCESLGNESVKVWTGRGLLGWGMELSCSLQGSVRSLRPADNFP